MPRKGRKRRQKRQHVQKHQLPPVSPPCVECGTAASVREVTGETIYPHRQDLWEKRFWQCACGAYVGCHQGTSNPYGYPCGEATRRARQAAHRMFDPMWKRKMELSGQRKAVARDNAYKWLADELGIRRESCHIGMFDKAAAERVVEICSRFYKKGKP